MTYTPSEEERLHTAYHEAGHAVIGRILTLTCGSATIVANEEDGEAGHGIIADPYVTDDAWQRRGKYRQFDSVLIGRILTYMAGAEAAEFMGHSQGGDGDDRRQIAHAMDNLSRSMSHERWDRFERRMRAMTRTLVRRHRERIERVAQALLDRHTLSSEEIGKLVDLKEHHYPDEDEAKRWFAALELMPMAIEAGDQQAIDLRAAMVEHQRKRETRGDV